MLALRARRLLLICPRRFASGCPRDLSSSSVERDLSKEERLVVLEGRRDDRVQVVRLNDPARLNSLTADMGDQFLEVVDFLCNKGAEGLGAVVLTGTGRAFSAGGSLSFLHDRSNDSPCRNATVMRRFYERFLSMRRIPVPVIAALNGPAIGAGLCVSLGADVRIAAKDAKLGVTFVGLGLHPGMGSTYFLPKLIGQQNAARMLLTGDVISGEEAKAMGLVADVSESGEACVQDAIKLAVRMASAAPVAVRTCVRSIRMAQDEGLDRALWREADAQSQTYNTPDLKDGVEAVAEKRKPTFSLWESFSDK